MVCHWCGEPLDAEAHGNTRYHEYCLTAKRNDRWQAWYADHREQRNAYNRERMRAHRNA